MTDVLLSMGAAAGGVLVAVGIQRALGVRGPEAPRDWELLLLGAATFSACLALTAPHHRGPSAGRQLWWTVLVVAAVVAMVWMRAVGPLGELEA